MEGKGKRKAACDTLPLGGLKSREPEEVERRRERNNLVCLAARKKLAPLI